MTIGALLMPTNSYPGLKVCWRFKLSTTAPLIAFVLEVTAMLRPSPWALPENNLNQTTAPAKRRLSPAARRRPFPPVCCPRPGRSLTIPAWPLSAVMAGTSANPGPGIAMQAL